MGWLLQRRPQDQDLRPLASALFIIVHELVQHRGWKTAAKQNLWLLEGGDLQLLGTELTCSGHLSKLGKESTFSGFEFSVEASPLKSSVSTYNLWTALKFGNILPKCVFVIFHAMHLLVFVFCPLKLCHALIKPLALHKRVITHWRRGLKQWKIIFALVDAMEPFNGMNFDDYLDRLESIFFSEWHWSCRGCSVGTPEGSCGQMESRCTYHLAWENCFLDAEGFMLSSWSKVKKIIDLCDILPAHYVPTLSEAAVSFRFHQCLPKGGRINHTVC